MQILCITHADFEGAGIIETWAQEKQFDFQYCRPYRGDAIPAVETFDILFLMGGPQSPLKIAQAPYLQDEISLITATIQQDKKIMGFCLGAQLIGEALGAPTERSPEREIGVYPITLTEDALNDPLLEGFPETFPVTHWHNDMPGLTSDAVLLAYSTGCPRQIIRYQPKVYGFQCHLEMTLDGIQQLIAAIPQELQASQFTQTKEALVQQDYQPINEKMIDILNRFVLLP